VFIDLPGVDELKTTMVRPYNPVDLWSIFSLRRHKPFNWSLCKLSEL